MRQWLADLVLGHIKLFSTELFWKKNPFFTQFLAKFHSNYFKLLFFNIFFIFLQLKKIKSNSLVTVWYALRLSQQPTVSLNYSQSIKINMAPSDGGTIISSFNRPTVIYLRLTDFNWHSNQHLVLFQLKQDSKELSPRPLENAPKTFNFQKTL